MKSLPGLAFLMAWSICSSSRHRALKPDRGWLLRQMEACGEGRVNGSVRPLCRGAQRDLPGWLPEQAPLAHVCPRHGGCAAVSVGNQNAYGYLDGTLMKALKAI